MQINAAKYGNQTGITMVMKPSSFTTHSVIKIIGYFLIFITAGLALAYAFTLNINWGFSNYIKKVFYIGIFLLLGMVHVFCFAKWLQYLYRRNLKTRLLYSLLLTLALSVCLFLLFFYRGFQNPPLVIMGVFAFILPAAILQSWNYFDAISPKIYRPWFVPVAMPSQKKMALFVNDLEINIKLKMYHLDKKETSFTVAVPARLLLGKIFQQFLMELEAAETKIQLIDYQLQPYGWQFLLQRSFSRRVLDPEATLTDNKIKQKDTLLIERIKIT